MAKWINDSLLDLALTEIKTTCNKLVICSAQPTTFAQANNLPASSGYKLAEVAVDTTDFTLGDGTTGRRVTLAQQVNFAGLAAGTGNHLAWIDTVNSVLLHVSSATSQAVTVGGLCTVNAHYYEIRDPT